MSNFDRIPFISSYCDTWCERCAFTDRCSTYAVNIATEMCAGDVAAGLELAIGEPHPVGAPQPAPEWRLELENLAPTAEEVATATREERKRDARIEEMSLMKLAWVTSEIACGWLESPPAVVAESTDALVQEALELARWDAYLIAVKIRRALHGRDGQVPDEDDDPVQSDWNGSAKVALLLLERSESAWRVIASVDGGDTPTEVARCMSDLQQMLLKEFPCARSFVRPGFDDR